jgi:phage-related baseplate assembly protein
MSMSLSSLPAPAVIETLDFETLLAERKTALLALYPDAADVLDNESEPLNYLLQESCYRELALRQHVNDSVLAISLAYATETDLDYIGQDRFNKERLVLTPATDTTDTVMESDDAYRARLYASWDELSTAGPGPAYESLALGVDADIAAAKAVSPAPREVVVYILSHSNNGTPDQGLVDAVQAVIAADDVRPITDLVTVAASTVTPVTVVASLTLVAGTNSVGSAEILANANATMATLQARREIGKPLEISQIYAALHVAGVYSVSLSSPTSTVNPGTTGAAIITSVSLSAL